MSDGNFTTSDPTVTHFKCTKCGFIDAVEKDIVWECFDVKRYKGKRTYYGYCMKCESIMYPLELMDKNSK